VTSGNVRLPVSVTFQPASRSRLAVLSAAPSVDEMLNTRTSAFAGAGDADDVAELEVVTVEVAIDDDWCLRVAGAHRLDPTNRTPRQEQQHITIARRAARRSFAGSFGRPLYRQALRTRNRQVTSKPSDRAAPGLLLLAAACAAV